MRKHYGKVFAVIIVTFSLIAAQAAAYEILLDIDTDNDPNTINDFTLETNVIVKLVLAPTIPGEPIGWVEFGLGGSCLECDSVHEYGTEHDLINSEQQMWVQAAALDSGWGYAMTLGCPGNPGFHLLLWFAPVGGGTINLNEAIFLAEFNVWKAPPVSPECDQPPGNLATMPAQGEFWNYIQVGGPALGTRTTAWGQIKAIYR